jgi:hypothetical protein
VYIKPNTFLLCIFLFCIFLLYRTDSHVEVQIRILLKDKYKKSCQKCEHLQSHFDFLKNACPVSWFLRNNSRAKISFCYCVLLSCFVWIYNLTVTIVTQKYRELCLISETILIGFFILEKNLLIFWTGVSCFSLTHKLLYMNMYVKWFQHSKCINST